MKVVNLHTTGKTKLSTGDWVDYIYVPNPDRPGGIYRYSIKVRQNGLPCLHKGLARTLLQMRQDLTKAIEDGSIIPIRSDETENVS